MKITKAMGRACLRELEHGFVEPEATAALNEMCPRHKSGLVGWTEFNRDDELFALAMCAAIAGVKP